MTRFSHFSHVHSLQLKFHNEAVDMFIFSTLLGSLSSLAFICFLEIL